MLCGSSLLATACPAMHFIGHYHVSCLEHCVCVMPSQMSCSPWKDERVVALSLSLSIYIYIYWIAVAHLGF